MFVWLIPPKGDCTSAGLITLFKCTVPKTRLNAPKWLSLVLAGDSRVIKTSSQPISEGTGEKVVEGAYIETNGILPNSPSFLIILSLIAVRINTVTHLWPTFA